MSNLSHLCFLCALQDLGRTKLVDLCRGSDLFVALDSDPAGVGPNGRVRHRDGQAAGVVKNLKFRSINTVKISFLTFVMSPIISSKYCQ